MVKKTSSIKRISKNSAAFHHYELFDRYEAGLTLTGTEVKSLREKAPSLRDGYIYLKGKPPRIEAWLEQVHIPPYSHGNIWNHEPLRKRKLLLHKSELKKLFGATTQKGFTVVPLQLYFKHGKVKIELALAKGKKQYDKRDILKKKEAKKTMSTFRSFKK